MNDVQDLKKPSKILGVTEMPPRCSVLFAGADGELVYRRPSEDLCKLLGKDGSVFAEWPTQPANDAARAYGYTMDYTGETDIAVCGGDMKDKEIELLPCPFCGGTAIIFYDRDLCHYECTRCNGRTNERARDQTIAAQYWNTRTATAREARLVEALEHYANPTIWRIASEYVSEGYSDWYQPEQAHGFDVAAKALAEHRGEKANTEEKHDDG